MARIDHVSLGVPDLGSFLNRCRDAGATVIQVPKGHVFLTFVRDADGNLFEIKEVKNG
jgi:catechol 2,3-dioxygenase-like lactoylglutathione lyase family enzyme